MRSLELHHYQISSRHEVVVLRPWQLSVEGPVIPLIDGEMRMRVSYTMLD